MGKQFVMTLGQDQIKLLDQTQVAHHTQQSRESSYEKSGNNATKASLSKFLQPINNERPENNSITIVKQNAG